MRKTILFFLILIPFVSCDKNKVDSVLTSNIVINNKPISIGINIWSDGAYTDNTNTSANFERNSGNLYIYLKWDDAKNENITLRIEGYNGPGQYSSSYDNYMTSVYNNEYFTTQMSYGDMDVVILSDDGQLISGMFEGVAVKFDSSPTTDLDSIVAEGSFYVF